MRADGTSLCRHFGTCGGCLTQDLTGDAYHAAKRREVETAFARFGFAPELVRDVISVSPGTRRRASLKAKKSDAVVSIGFHARQSHSIVDMQECRVLTPALVTLIQRLRDMLAGLLRGGDSAELHLTDTDTGPDLALRWNRKINAAQNTELARWATRLKLARITANGEIAFESAAPEVHFGKARVRLPPESFLQPTREGERLLQDAVREILSDTKSAADLFCGCGTFTLPLAETARVHSVELDDAMLQALAAAARGTQRLKPVSTEKRDLFQQPLTARDLNAFGAVLLDPPRAGALAQVREIAQSRVARVAYVSCDAGTFARDARVLADAGYHMAPVLPVDQFLWSSHIELVGAFSRS